MSASDATSPATPRSRRDCAVPTCRGRSRRASATPSEPSNRRDQIDEIEPERLGPSGDLLGDRAEPEESERAALQAPSPLRTPSCPSGRHGSSATLSGIRRSSAMTSPNASSATAVAFFPGQFETYTPRAEAAATSMVL